MLVAPRRRRVEVGQPVALVGVRRHPLGSLRRRVGAHLVPVAARSDGLGLDGGRRQRVDGGDRLSGTGERTDGQQQSVALPRGRGEVGGRHRREVPGGGPALRVGDRGLAGEAGGQAGQRGRGEGWHDVGRADALGDGVRGGVRTDDGHGVHAGAGQGERAGRVLQQHGGPLRRGQGEGGVRGRVDRCPRGARRRTADHAVREHLGQHLPDVVVDRGHRQPAARQRVGQDIGRARLQQLHVGAHGQGLVMDGTQVGAHESGEAPLLQQQSQTRVLALEGAVEPGVGAHERRHVGLGDGRLERGEVDLLEGAGGHRLVEGTTVGLLGVDGEVLGVGHHPTGLDPLDVGRAQHRGEERVLAVGLVGPPAGRDPVDVDVGPLTDVDALSGGLGTDQVAVLERHRRVEGGPDGQGHRQLGHPGVAVGQSPGSVGQREGGDAESRHPAVDVLVVPGADEDEFAQLLVQGHPCEDQIGEGAGRLARGHGVRQPRAARHRHRGRGQSGGGTGHGPGRRGDRDGGRGRTGRRGRNHAGEDAGDEGDHQQGGQPGPGPTGALDGWRSARHGTIVRCAPRPPGCTR